MHLDFATLQAGLDEVRRSPTASGTLELIVRRPEHDLREVLAEATLDPTTGLVGDAWYGQGADLERQLTIMNSRAVALVAGAKDRWPLAGDQLYVDFDLSEVALPPGSRLQVGAAVVEVSTAPHRGCKKFAARYGLDALRFVNSKEGYALHLRGINARVLEGGAIRSGDPVRRLATA